MGLFEYHNRYLALRLYMSRLAACPVNHRYLIHCLILICMVIAPACKCQVPSNIEANETSILPFITLENRVENIATDENGNSVFILVNNGIYRFTNDFKLITSTASIKKATSLDGEASQIDWKNKVLSLIRNRDNSELLFSCWQTRNSSLACFLNKVNDLKSASLRWANDNRGFKLNQSDRLKVLAIQSDSMNLLLINSRLTPVETRAQMNSTQSEFLSAISRLKIVKNSNHQVSLDLISVLDYAPQIAETNLIYDYAAAFDYNQHTHFILNDIRKPVNTNSNLDNQQQSVRMARICNNDTGLTSYTEISLTCNNQENLYAKTAHLDQSGSEPTLNIIFEEMKSSTKGSVLCTYSMKLIEDIFNKAVSDCNLGHQSSTLLAKLHPGSVQPPLCQRNPSPAGEWCTSKTNPYIDGTSYMYNLKEDSHHNLASITNVNFLLPLSQGNQPRKVYFIGTESGFLTKISAEEDLFYTVDLNSMKVKGYKIGDKLLDVASNNTDESQSTTRYTASSRYIIASTLNRVSRIDTDTCQYYTSCQTCLTTRDPLNCVWCDSSCAKKSDCPEGKQFITSCPPTITNFLPKIGPTTGQTRIRIVGENFGTSKGKLSVKIGEQNCIVDRQASNSDLIECLTRPTDKASVSNITITVEDESTYIYSSGTVSSNIPFQYANVTVFGLYPHSGPLTGGSKAFILGDNLNIGSNRTILLGDIECAVYESKSNRLTCVTKPLDVVVAPESHTNYEKSLKVLVDGVEQALRFKNYHDGKNLSISYTYRADMINREEVNEVSIGDLNDNESNIVFILMMLAFIVIISILIVYLCINGKIPTLNGKPTSPPFDPKKVELADAKVSFRNPQSNKFANTNFSSGTGSLNGLIKLNGSVMSSDYFGKPEQLEQDQPLMNRFLDNEMLAILAQEKILIDRGRLTLGHVLGSGQFGRVYKGFLKIEATGEHAEVAVKTLHSRSLWDDDLDNRAFLEEGLMMKDFDHENVLALIGVTFDSNGLPMVITPFMLYGDLKSYISDEASSPTVKELIDYGIQVARGMAYLSNLKFVHRDLAARNCMLDEKLLVKVADFGLSRDIYERDYYSSDNKKTKLPVKWMAIESLEKCIYNTKTDVWSFGILLWELLTRGVVPYPDVDNFDLFSYLKEGRRMLRPRYCPKILYKIMLSCWDENPANRPAFSELVEQVSDVIKQLKAADDGQQKVSRDITYCDVPK